MSPGNPSGPIVLAGEPAPETAESIAWDVAHLVANGVTVAVACDPDERLVTALESVGVATETVDADDVGTSAETLGVVEIVSPTAAEATATALDATLVMLGGECVPGEECVPDDAVAADSSLKNPVIGVLGESGTATEPDGTESDGGYIEVAL